MRNISVFLVSDLISLLSIKVSAQHKELLKGNMELNGKLGEAERLAVQRMFRDGYVNPAEVVHEGTQIGNARDEGCAEKDWLRLNLKLFEMTGNIREQQVI
jgi:hypothetical protein